MTGDNLEMMNPPLPPDKMLKGVQLNVLVSIANDLLNDPRIQAIFGADVGSMLAVVTEKDRLKLIDANKKALTKKQKSEFTAILKETIQKHKKK